MLAWMPMPDEKPSAERQTRGDTASLLYRLTVAFPSWAGAVLAIYSICLYGFAALKTRLK
jgi:hypothetical protein